MIGIAILTAMVYILPGVRSSGNQEMDRSARTASVGSAPAIYKKACAACHDTGVAGAPGFGDRAAWDPRGRQGVQRLLRTVVAGKGAMPPRGTCADCSDADLEAVIEYLLVQAGYKPAMSDFDFEPQRHKGHKGHKEE